MKQFKSLYKYLWSIIASTLTENPNVTRTAEGEFSSCNYFIIMMEV
jgi:hypothetical protein